MHHDQASARSMRTGDQAFLDLEVARGRLQSIVDEAGAALIRTAFSYIVREAKDFACAILATDGRTVVQSAQSIPVFLGTMTLTARQLLRDFPPESWQPGDVVGTNDPWLGTGHLHDLTLLTPVFVDQTVVAFSGVVAHLPDIGGRLPGSDATQCFEEGLRIPPMKIATAQGIDPVLLAILEANVRMPDQVMGDVNAAFNASSVISRRLQALCQEISVARFVDVCRQLEARTEAFMRRAISEVPDGSYSAEIESEGANGIPFGIKLRVDVSGDEIVVDFAGTSKQIAAGINSCYSYSRAYTLFALKCVLAPALPFNEGILTPIRVTAPEGSIVNSRFPAAGTARNLVGHFIPTLVCNALASVVPDQTIAESAAPQSIVRVSGLDVARGSLYIAPITVPGGFGARATKDGPPCLNFPTNTETVSMEMLESSCPFRFEEAEFRTDSGGEGEFQGGLGQRVTVRALAERTHVSVMAQRLRQAPRGVHGGGNGSTTRVCVNQTEIADPSKVLTIATGETVTLESAGGGGFGPPRRRDPARVAADVEGGYLSIEKAARVYGYAGPGPTHHAKHQTREGKGHS